MAATGVIIDTRDFPTTSAGMRRALDWVGRRKAGDADTLWVIEGAASYGALLTGTLITAGYPMAETARILHATAASASLTG